MVSAGLSGPRDRLVSMRTFFKDPGLTAILALALVVMLGACSDEEASPTDNGAASQPDSSQNSGDASEEMFPDIVGVEVTREDEQTASFAVTVSSPYDSPQRYADGWRVLDQDGDVLGEHTLGHDHASEQPFTRTQDGVSIPEGTTELTVEGRDQVSGYGGDTVTVDW